MNKVVNFIVGLLMISGLCLVGYVVYKKVKPRPHLTQQKPQAPIVQVMTESAPADPLDPETVEVLKKIVRIDPESIKAMPTSLRFTLKRENCAVVEQNKSPVWMKGSFYKKGQVDYAALCITPENEMTIKVLWGAERPNCSISLAYGKAEKFVTLNKEGHLSFSRTLALANSKRVQYYARKNNLELPSEIPEGIEDTIIERKSTIYYCNGTQWVPSPTP